MNAQLTLDGSAPPLTRQQVTRELLATFPVSRETAGVLASVILGKPVWVVTLSGARNQGTFGLFGTGPQAEEWAAKHNPPAGNFIIPVKPPSLLDGDPDA